MTVSFIQITIPNLKIFQQTWKQIRKRFLLYNLIIRWCKGGREEGEKERSRSSVFWFVALMDTNCRNCNHFTGRKQELPLDLLHKRQGVQHFYHCLLRDRYISRKLGQNRSFQDTNSTPIWVSPQQLNLMNPQHLHLEAIILLGLWFLIIIRRRSKQITMF